MKKTACLILIFALCAVFAACTGKDTAGTTAGETAAITMPAETTGESPVETVIETAAVLPPASTDAQTPPAETAAPAETKRPAPPPQETLPPETPVDETPVEETPVEETTAPLPEEPEVFDFATSDLSAYIVLGKYLGMEVALPAPRPVTDADVDDAVNEAIAALPLSAMVTDRACTAGDKVNVAYIGAVDGEVFNQSGADGFTLVLGSHATVDGFEDGILGMQAGQTRTVTVTFPQDYYPELAGKEADFEITLNYIYPLLDDTLAQNYFDAQTADDCRAQIKAALEGERAAGTAQEKETATWTKALANSRIIAYPEEEVDAAFAAFAAEYAALAEKYGLTYETVFPTLYGIPLEEAERVLRDGAENQVAQRLLLYAVARDMGMDVSDEKFESDLAATAGIIGAESVDALIAQLGKDRTSLKEDKLYSEIIEVMIGKATFVTLQ